MKDQTRFQSQLKWFVKKISGELESSGLKIIDLEGQDYDAGMAVSALNIDDFDESEELYIDQVLSPLIMSEKGIEQMGTVILGSKKMKNFVGIDLGTTNSAIASFDGQKKQKYGKALNKMTLLHLRFISTGEAIS